MIPTIEEIVLGLLQGTYTGTQAESWLRAHMDLAEEMARGDLRDEFAGQAMQGLLASNVRAKEMEFAEQAYEMADAMLKARAQ